MLAKVSTMELLVAFFGLTAANPLNRAETLDKRGQFKVEQFKSGGYQRHGPTQMLKAFKKFGKGPMPAHMAALNSALAQGSVPATPGDAYDSLYVSSVKTGCTTVNLDFDTGSSDLWVFSSLQPSSQATGHKTYNPSSCSSSKLKSGYSWDISYGDGSGASGTVYADKVVVGGVTATSQAVEAATSVSDAFTQDTATDGLLGLAFSKINTVTPQKQTTFFDTVKSTLAKPVFCADLKYHAAGSYDFGFIDSSKFTGKIDYTKVDSSQGFWGFSASGYQVGKGSAKRSTISAIADTGTTLLLVPDAIVSAYYAGISGVQQDGSGYYNFPCSATLPDLSFTIAGGAHTIPGKYINYAPNNDGTCFGGVQSSSSIGINIFGDIFLKSQYVVFDSAGQIGFAQQ